VRGPDGRSLFAERAEEAVLGGGEHVVNGGRGSWGDVHRGGGGGGGLARGPTGGGLGDLGLLAGADFPWALARAVDGLGELVGAGGLAAVGNVAARGTAAAVFAGVGQAEEGRLVAEPATLTGAVVDTGPGRDAGRKAVGAGSDAVRA